MARCFDLDRFLAKAHVMVPIMVPVRVPVMVLVMVPVMRIWAPSDGLLKWPQNGDLVMRFAKTP